MATTGPAATTLGQSRKNPVYRYYVGIVVLATICNLVFFVSTIRNSELPGEDSEHLLPSIQQQQQQQQQKQQQQPKKCIPLSNQPLQKVTSLDFQYYRDYKNMSELTRVTGDYESPLAICKLTMGQGSTWMFHFPHVMQHMYACYSYWQDNPSKVPVLYPVGVGKGLMDRRHSKNPFLKGFMEFMTSQLKVKILYDWEIVDWLKLYNVNANANANTTITDTSDNGGGGIGNIGDVSNFKTREIQRPLGYVLSHAKSLNELAQRHFEIGDGEEKRNTNNNTNTNNNPNVPPPHTTTTTNNNNNNTTTLSCSSSPRIGILNRKPSSGRSITNAEDLVRNIISEIFINNTGNNNNNNNNNNNSNNTSTSTSSPLAVSLEYFEGGNNFEEQVRFFNNIDILLSPHGAQLTGIPFLANKPCTQLIEFFPDRYFMPDFFGSLAVDSNIAYSYIYASSTSPQAQALYLPTTFQGRIVLPNIKIRSKDRAKNLCLDKTVVVDAVRDAILDWCKCKKKKKT